MNRFELAITPGDPEGIGPEVTAKALLKLEKALRPVSVSIFGSKDAFKREKAFLRKTTASFIEPPARSSPDINPVGPFKQLHSLSCRVTRAGRLSPDPSAKNV